MSLHGRIALLLGWEEGQTKSFSLRALRDLVRMCPPSKHRDELVREIDSGERSGNVIQATDS